MYCPICSAVTYECSKLLYPGSLDGPPEHEEYNECYVCLWNDKPVMEDMEIPF